MMTTRVTDASRSVVATSAPCAEKAPGTCPIHPPAGSAAPNVPAQRAPWSQTCQLVSRPVAGDLAAGAYAGGVKLHRKHGIVLLGIAIWNVATYARFTKALVETEEDRPTSYFVAH